MIISKQTYCANLLENAKINANKKFNHNNLFSLDKTFVEGPRYSGFFSNALLENEDNLFVLLPLLKAI
jgi:hypothetical protein